MRKGLFIRKYNQFWAVEYCTDSIGITLYAGDKKHAKKELKHYQGLNLNELLSTVNMR